MAQRRDHPGRGCGVTISPKKAIFDGP
jgi:hypothetical protein